MYLGMNADQFGWAVFAGVVLIAMAVDLVLQRSAHVVSTREALAWTGVWVGLAIAFNIFIYFLHGEDRALYFLQGYLIEESLSVDNLFVFLVIFKYFQIPKECEARVLRWGIVGALVMRAGAIVGGIALIHAFHWTTYVFGGLLLVTAVKLVVKREEEPHLERNFVVRLAKRILPIAPVFDGARFFTRVDGRRKATILFLTVLVVESSDVMFALDSIPAVFGIFPKIEEADTFIVYTSNVFAIMGLRTLYFLLAKVMDLFHFLKYGLAVILAFVGVKLILGQTVHFSTLLSLGVIMGVLLASILASVIFKPKSKE